MFMKLRDELLARYPVAARVIGAFVVVTSIGGIVLGFVARVHRVDVACRGERCVVTEHRHVGERRYEVSGTPAASLVEYKGRHGGRSMLAPAFAIDLGNSRYAVGAGADGIVSAINAPGERSASFEPEANGPLYVPHIVFVIIGALLVIPRRLKR